MKHLISTQTAGSKLPEEEKFRILAAAGFDAVDFGFFEYASFAYCARREGKSFFERSDEEVLSYFHRVGGFARDAGLRIGQCHAPFPCNEDIDLKAVVTPRHLRLLRLSLLAAGEMGCPYVVIHPAFSWTMLYYRHPEALKEVWKVNQEMYLSLVPAARKANVMICLENMWQRENGAIVPGLLYTCEMFARWIDDLNESAGEERFCACLDTGHAVLTNQDPGNMIRVLGKRLRALHLHDVVKDNDLHTAPFDGVCDWEALAKALGESGYAGTLNFETYCFQTRRPPELYSATTEFLAKSAAWFRDRVDENCV